MSKTQKIKKISAKAIKSKEKKRKHQKKCKLKSEIKIFLTILLVSLIFIVLSFTVLFKIENISINGCDIYNHKKIIDESGIKIGSNLLLCNKSNVVKNIVNNFPYVEEVKVLKKLPSSVELNIKIGTADFAIENNGEYFYISERGKILEKSGIRPQNLLVIRGVTLNNYSQCAQIEFKNSDVKKIIQEIKENIQNNNLDKIDTIDLSDLNKIILVYDNRINLLMGNLEKFEYKIITAKEILENKINNSEKGNLNLSELEKDNKSYFIPEQMGNS